MKPSRWNQSKLWLDRHLSTSIVRQILIVCSFLIVIWGLSTIVLWIGFREEWTSFSSQNNLPLLLWPFYLLIDPNSLNNLYISKGAEEGINWGFLIVSTLTFIIGIFIFNGIIIGIITNYLERRVRNHREGKTYYLKSGHYIIMGFDNMVPSIINHIFEKDEDPYILILTSAKANEVREKLLKTFSPEQMKRIIINFGHRVSTDSFKNINLENAWEIYVVGNHNKPEHDAINVESLDCIRRYLTQPGIKSFPRRITCFFNDADTYAAFKTSDIFSEIEKLDVEFLPYNYLTGWANRIFVTRHNKNHRPGGNYFEYPSVYGAGITSEDERFVHLVFTDVSPFSVALAMEAANLLHFANADKKKTLITFIDPNMDTEKDRFISRNRHLFEIQPYLEIDLTEGSGATEHEKNEYVTFDKEDAGFLDVQFRFVKGDFFSKEVQDLIKNWAGEHTETQYLSLFFASPEQSRNFAMAMNMPDEVYDNEVNIFIHQNRSDNFVTNLREADKKRTDQSPDYAFVDGNGSLVTVPHRGKFSNIYPFGMYDSAFCIDEASLRHAKLINYLYKTADYTQRKFTPLSQLDTMSGEEVWKEANKLWNHLSVPLKWSNLYNAYSLRIKMDTLKALRNRDVDFEGAPLSEEEIDILAKIEHNRWNVEKLLMGYRKARPSEDKYRHKTYAETLAKNKSLFIHHDIRPYSGLDSIYNLDREFIRYLPWIIRMAAGQYYMR